MMSTYDVREMLTEIILYNASLGSQRKMKGGNSLPISECHSYKRFSLTYVR